MTTPTQAQIEAAKCPHELWEREASVVTEGYCPICMAERISALTAAAEMGEQGPAMTKPTDAQRYERLSKSFAKLQSAALEVVKETDHTYDTEPWPIKYRAPYAAITKLRKLLLQFGGAK